MDRLRYRAIKVLAAVAVVVVASAVAQIPPLGSDDGEATERESRDGDLKIQSVGNRYTEALQVFVSPVDGDSLVDPFVPMLEPGESSGPATPSCTSEWGRATGLLVLARTTDDGETVAERKVALAPVDCQPDGGAVFDVTVAQNATVSIDRSG